LRSRWDDEKEEDSRFTRIHSPVIYAGEVNYAYPTVWSQVDLARRYCKKNEVPLEDVNLILLNGGINDMGATKILLPKLLGGNIAVHAHDYCEVEMSLLLDKLANTFPNARMIVPGYFPLVSVRTPEKVVLETIGYLFLHKKDPGNSQGAIKEQSASAPNAIAASQKPGIILKKLDKRSKEWASASNAALTTAVNSFNTSHPLLPIAGNNVSSLPPKASMRAIFVPVSFADENAYAANNAYLWRLFRRSPNLVLECAEKDPLKNLIVIDELQAERPCMCDQADKRNDIICLRAAAFHPNIQGAEAYFAAIEGELEKIWPFTRWGSE